MRIAWSVEVHYDIALRRSISVRSRTRVLPLQTDQVAVTAGGGLLAYSTDSARTFTTVNPAGEGGTTGGDPSMTFDDRSNPYFSYLAFQKLGRASYWGRGTFGNGIWVVRSPDGGKTFRNYDWSDRSFAGRISGDSESKSACTNSSAYSDDLSRGNCGFSRDEVMAMVIQL